MIRVLVVDDDFMVARVHAGFVERIPGFTVVGTAHSGADALTAVHRLLPDLVLLDIHLPDISGVEVLRRVREDEPDVDVLVVSAAREVETVQRALRGGVVNYLVKPFDQKTLRTRLEDYADRRRNLARMAHASQEDVDRHFPGSGGTATARTAMPKGLTAETAEVVRSSLIEAGPDGQSASECAESTGLSRVSARRYLEFFVRAGRADVQPRYGTTGRPERRFRWRT
jgi:response regulator of citrate/malate metabolism